MCKVHFSGAANVVPVKLLALHDYIHSRVVSVFSACARNLTRMRTRGDRQDYSTRSGGCYRSGARIMNGASEITKELHLAP